MGERLGVRNGLFVPPNVHRVQPSETDMNTASIFFGVLLGGAAFAAVKAARQSWGTWKRHGRVSIYIAMLWGHWASNMGIAPLTWLYLRGTVRSSFSLLIPVKSTTVRLRWTVLILIGIINVSVFVIWIPANLRVSPTWVHINSIWDRIEKCIFLVIDASLNCYFVYLVRTRLIANGLTKYTTLFKFNLAMIIFSVSLDAALVGLMSLHNHIVYLQFQCTAYMTKLQIEMNMADLIRKVVRASNEHNQIAGTYANPPRPKKRRSWTPKKFIATISRGANHIEDVDVAHHVAHAERGEAYQLARSASAREATLPPPTGIKKTIKTEVSISRRGEEDEHYSISSSTRHLNDHEPASTSSSRSS
ncbi:hypothetical protein F4780DRAFT_771935 [Xylariomycetidae sp. FL0641]|nr:hypothetical protein F4780DRAFT_771935 [Xylariomycetidae sp. FL0641]